MSATVALSAAIELALALIEQGARISILVRQARAEGRDSLSDEEWKQIIDEDDSAIAALESAIATAKAEGR